MNGNYIPFFEKEISKIHSDWGANQLDQSFQVDLKVSAPPGCPDRLLSGVFWGWIYWMLSWMFWLPSVKLT